MNYAKYVPVDFVNGVGVRCTLFVTGCQHKCHGCYNKTTWNPREGFAFTQEMEDQIIADLKCTKIERSGLSLSGGDPMYRDNVNSILKLVKRVKEECPDKNIWMWTGFTLDQLKEDPLRKEILSYIDVLVDGKFVEELKDPELAFRGSSNQNIIDIKNIEV